MSPAHESPDDADRRFEETFHDVDQTALERYQRGRDTVIARALLRTVPEPKCDEGTCTRPATYVASCRRHAGEISLWCDPHRRALQGGRGITTGCGFTDKPSGALRWAPIFHYRDQA